MRKIEARYAQFWRDSDLAYAIKLGLALVVIFAGVEFCVDLLLPS